MYSVAGGVPTCKKIIVEEASYNSIETLVANIETTQPTIDCWEEEEITLSWNDWLIKKLCNSADWSIETNQG